MARLFAVALAACIAGCAVQAPPPAPSAPPPVAPPVSVDAPAAAPPASPPPPPERPAGVVLACEGGERLTVRTFPDEVHVAGLGEQVEVLLRDAGGVTPQQAVFSNRRWRAEFGLGADAREARLQQIDPGSRTLRCRRP